MLFLDNALLFDIRKRPDFLELREIVRKRQAEYTEEQYWEREQRM
jgi:hypothetical protein